MFRNIAAIIAIICFFSITLFSQQNNNLPVERIFKEDVRNMTTPPSFKWIGDNTILLFNRNHNNQFEILDVSNLDIKKYFNADELINKLSNKIDKLSLPKNINSSGKMFLYVFNGDIFLVTLPELSVTQVTNTELIEKCTQFSPDSKYISFVRENNIFAYNIFTKEETQLTFSENENILNGTLSWIYWEEFFGRQDTGYWWSPDSKSIAYLNTDESEVTTMHYVDFQPETPRVIKQKYPKSGGINPVVEVGVVNIDNASNSFIDFNGFAYEYIARVKWLPDNKRLAIQTLNRAQDELNLFFTNPVSQKTEWILKETDSAWVNINEDLYFLNNSDRFIWASERTGYMHLYLYKNNGELINQITKGDWACSSSGLGVFWLKNTVCNINEQDESIYFISIKNSHLGKQLFKINFDGTGLEQITNTSGTHAISFSPNGNTFIDKYSSASTPPIITLHKNDNTKMMEIWNSNTELITSLNIKTPELFTIKARDNFDIPARIIKPINFDPNKKYPVVMYIYGGPCAPQVKDEWQGNYLYENVLIQNGFICVSIDHRGATGISKTLENMMSKMMLASTELTDLEDAVKWLKEQSFVDAENVGVWGRSGGGGNTLSAMTSLKEFKAGIAVAGISDWKFYNTKLTETAMKRPVDNPEGYEKTSSVNRAANLHGRLMIIHGTYDDNVHIQNTWAFANELIKNNIKFDMMIYPMRKHSFADLPAQIHYFNTMLEFWNENLK